MNHYEQQELNLPVSTSYSPAHHASVRALLESVWELLTSVTDGRNASESYARLGPDGSWLKTFRGSCQLMMDGSLEEYCESWTKWGTMLRGVCSEPVTWARRISEKDCASWPTVTINGNYNQKGMSDTSGDGLASAVKQWPTPRAQSGNGPSETETRQGGADLQTVVMWPTCTSRDWKDTTNKVPPSRQKPSKQTLGQSMAHEGAQKGQLNPAWVACLMGYPEDWLSDPREYRVEAPPTDKEDAIYSIESRLSAQPWPAGRGERQYDWEPPRVAEGVKNRAKHIEMLGNAVVPAWAYVILASIAAIEGGKVK